MKKSTEGTNGNHNHNHCHNHKYQKELQKFFSHFAQRTARQAGRASSFMLALFLVVLWAISGPLFDYSVSWLVVVDTTCSIFTVLMVLLIQNTQYRDTQAIQMKLDELIQTNKNARNDLIEIEKLTEGEIEEVRDIQREIREHAEGVHVEEKKVEEKPGKNGK